MAFKFKMDLRRFPKFPTLVLVKSSAGRAKSICALWKTNEILIDFLPSRRRFLPSLVRFSVFVHHRSSSFSVVVQSRQTVDWQCWIFTWFWSRWKLGTYANGAIIGLPASISIMLTHCAQQKGLDRREEGCHKLEHYSNTFRCIWGLVFTQLWSVCQFCRDIICKYPGLFYLFSEPTAETKSC